MKYGELADWNEAFSTSTLIAAERIHGASCVFSTWMTFCFDEISFSQSVLVVKPCRYLQY
jgi:hypothetical protein